jgi:uncharacterized protein (DUF2235 family)
VIFYDGTANDEGSDTNVKRLHSLITLQNKPNIASLYVQGVGTNFDPVGAAFGAGINARVALGYEFILNHYQRRGPDVPADEIYIFGFSRGAFNARILATMLNFAGIVREIPKEGALRKLTPKQLAEAVHEATFGTFIEFPKAERDSVRRMEKLAADLEKLRLRSDVSNGDVAVPVKVLGLWDSVQALGLGTLIENLPVHFFSVPPRADTDEPNLRYGEKLCNVERAYHALSIDDNRATTFTPLLLSRDHMFKGCPPNKGMLDEHRAIKAGALQEVWFSGAHSDVGGGYATSALSGVSLNWMLNRLRCDGLLPKTGDGLLSKADCIGGKDVKLVREDDKPVRKDDKPVREDFLGGSHDPRAGWGAIYPNVSRDLVDFSFHDKAIVKANPRPLCVHESVVQRRGLIGTNQHEYTQMLLEKDGVVQLTPDQDGKGRWREGLRERKDSTKPADKKMIDVQVYPDCHFMKSAVQTIDPAKEAK